MAPKLALRLTVPEDELAQDDPPSSAGGAVAGALRGMRPQDSWDVQEGSVTFLSRSYNPYQFSADGLIRAGGGGGGSGRAPPGGSGSANANALPQPPPGPPPGPGGGYTRPGHVLSQSNLGPRPPGATSRPQQQQQLPPRPGGASGASATNQQQQQAYRISDRDIFLLRRLGQGASGTVYKGFHVPRKRFVAVKRVDLAERARRQQLLNDVRALCGAPSAPGLVAFEGAYHAPGSGQISIVLEYLDGGSLADVLGELRAEGRGGGAGGGGFVGGGGQPAAPPPPQPSRQQPHPCSQPLPHSQSQSERPPSNSFQGLPEPLLAQLARDVLRGLAALHARRTVHRDVKPGNILLSLSSGEAKITDFGISAFAVDSTLAACETFTGTVTYMSPERVESRPYGFAADVWSVGLVLLECATGRYPYDASAGPLQLMIEVVQGDPPLPAVRGANGGLGASQASPESRWGSGGGGGATAAASAGGASATAARGVSPELRDLLARCLDKDPARRPSAAALLEHPFLVKHGWGPGGNGNAAAAAAAGGAMAVDEGDEGGDGDDDARMRELARRWPDLRAFLADVAFDPLEKLDEIALVFAFSYYELLSQAAEAAAAAAAAAGGAGAAAAAAGASGSPGGRGASSVPACVRQLESLYTSASVLTHEDVVARGRAAIAARLQAAATTTVASASGGGGAPEGGGSSLAVVPLAYRPLSVDCQPLGLDGSALVHVIGAISCGGGAGGAGSSSAGGSSSANDGSGGGGSGSGSGGGGEGAAAATTTAQFSETFILAQSAPGEYYVANQCFRVLR